MSAAVLRPPPGAFDEDEIPERVPGPAPSAAQLAAATSVAKLVGGKLDKAERPRSFRVTKGAAEKVREQMFAMAESADWSSASGTHLVALYEWLHQEIYGVATAELDPKSWALAAQMAGRMTRDHFENDYGRAMVFIRWCWRREAKKVVWRRENGRPTTRIGWRLQFGGSLVTDYKVDCHDEALKSK